MEPTNNVVRPRAVIQSSFPVQRAFVIDSTHLSEDRVINERGLQQQTGAPNVQAVEESKPQVQPVNTTASPPVPVPRDYEERLGNLRESIAHLENGICEERLCHKAAASRNEEMQRQVETFRRKIAERRCPQWKNRVSKFLNTYEQKRVRNQVQNLQQQIYFQNERMAKRMMALHKACASKDQHMAAKGEDICASQNNSITANEKASSDTNDTCEKTTLFGSLFGACQVLANDVAAPSTDRAETKVEVPQVTSPKAPPTHSGLTLHSSRLPGWLGLVHTSQEALASLRLMSHNEEPCSRTANKECECRSVLPKTPSLVEDMDDADDPAKFFKFEKDASIEPQKFSFRIMKSAKNVELQHKKRELKFQRRTGKASTHLEQDNLPSLKTKAPNTKEGFPPKLIKKELLNGPSQSPEEVGTEVVKPSTSQETLASLKHNEEPCSQTDSKACQCSSVLPQTSSLVNAMDDPAGEFRHTQTNLVVRQKMLLSKIQNMYGNFKPKQKLKFPEPEVVEPSTSQETRAFCDMSLKLMSQNNGPRTERKEDGVLPKTLSLDESESETEHSSSSLDENHYSFYWSE